MVAPGDTNRGCAAHHVPDVVAAPLIMCPTWLSNEISRMVARTVWHPEWIGGPHEGSLCGSGDDVRVCNRVCVLRGRFERYEHREGTVVFVADGPGDGVPR